MTNKIVAVYGAGGHTGQFVVRELHRREVPAILIGRHRVSQLSEPGDHPAHWCREARCEDSDSLDRALAGAQAVINCAGPFMDTADSLVEAALRNRIHYLDVTAEQATAMRTFEIYDEPARAAGIAVLPAMAFYGGLADLLTSALAAEATVVDRVRIGVALDFWHPTHGTRQTGERNSARRLIVSGGRLIPLPEPTPPSTWVFPQPFGEQPVIAVPLSEIVTIFRHINAREVMSYMNRAPLDDLGSPDTPAPRAVDSAGRSAQRFVMEVEVHRDGRVHRMSATGRDIYAVTAPLVVEACVRLLASPTLRGGAFAAGSLFDAADFLHALLPSIQVSTPTFAETYRQSSVS
jgi:uncharacterized protein YbjT (DUF2867 family)